MLTRLIFLKLLKITRVVPGQSDHENDRMSIMLRAYGGNTDLLVNRDAEIVVHKLLEREGLAKPLLARFENGLLYKFTPGRVCEPEDLRQQHIWKAIAATLGEWHARLPRPKVLADGANAGFRPFPTIWAEMERWLSNLPNGKGDRRIPVLRQEVERSRRELSNMGVDGQPGVSLYSAHRKRTFLWDNGLIAPQNVFGHTDLLAANIILVKDTDHDARVSFIDYEFAGPCSAAYDLANHFAEWAGSQLDYNLIPTRSERQRFIEEYLRAYDRYTSAPEADFEERVNQLMDTVDQYRGIPGLRWGIQAIVQEYLNIFPHFDFADYGGKRLLEYWASRGKGDGDDQAKTAETPLRESRWAQEK
jgi:ethanolamine kinase